MSPTPKATSRSEPLGGAAMSAEPCAVEKCDQPPCPIVRPKMTSAAIAPNFSQVEMLTSNEPLRTPKMFKVVSTAMPATAISFCRDKVMVTEPSAKLVQGRDACGINTAQKYCAK